MLVLIPDHGLVFAEGITPQNALTLLQRRRPALVAERVLDQPRYAVWKDHYKLIQVGEDQLELYSILDDPNEQTNLRNVLPGYVTSLQESLRAFVDHIAPPDLEEVNDDYDDDPEVYRRLRDLGYVD